MPTNAVKPAGVDEQTFEDIEKYGVERWLDELTQELKSRIYQPQPCANGSRAGSRTYLRGRSAAGTVCLSGRPQTVTNERSRFAYSSSVSTGSPTML